MCYCMNCRMLMDKQENMQPRFIGENSDKETYTDTGGPGAVRALREDAVVGFFRDFFYRTPWEDAGVAYPKETVRNALRKIGDTDHGAPVSMLDGQKMIRCLDWNSREEFLKELRWRFGKLPSYDLERFNCNHEWAARHGQACLLWADLSDGHEALGAGWCHLRYKDATNSHWAWIWVRDNLRVDIIQYRSLSPVVHRPIQAIYGVGQA